MKMRRIAGLLLTAACAVSLLCPAAWAVNASSVDKSGGNVRLSYRLQMPAVEDSAKIGADVKAQVKTTARRTSNSVVEIGMNSRADAESQLGMKFVSSSTLMPCRRAAGRTMWWFRSSRLRRSPIPCTTSTARTVPCR